MGYRAFFRSLDRFLRKYPEDIWLRHPTLEADIGHRAIEKLREARDINNNEATVGKLLERMKEK